LYNPLHESANGSPRVFDPFLTRMAIAPSPALANAPVHKLRLIALSLLIACLLLFGLDALLFRTGLYMSVLEPDSTAGLLELILRREKAAQAKAGDNLVVTLGNSRMGYVPKGVDLRPRQTGYVVRTAVVPGSDARSWYYLLRDLDPTAHRYRAIVFGVDDYDDEDRLFNLDDDIRALHYSIARLRLSDTIEFARSFHSPAVEWVAFRGALLKGIALQSDIQAFLSHPRKRIDDVHLYRDGYADWAYNFVESSRNLTGLQINWSNLTATYPPGMTEAEKDGLRSFLLHEPNPQTGRLARFLRTWLGRTADRYRRSSTKIIFFRLPRGPIPRPDNLVKKRSSSIRELASRPNVILADEHLFDILEHPEFFKDGMHMNRAGVDKFSAMLADEVARILGPPGRRAAR
jgi:lysophospholipase L1-like esterase